MSLRHVIWKLAVSASLLAIAYLGMSIITVLRDQMPRMPLTSSEWIVLGLAAVVSAHVVLLVHELGHIVGGWIAGYRFRLLIVGPLAIERDDGGLHVQWNRALQHYGGQVAMAPVDATASKMGAALHVALGPVASIAFGAAVTLAGLDWLSDPAVRDVSFRGFFISRQVAVIGVGSIVVGLANLVPMSFSGRRSDGARLWELMGQSQ
jgi:hypothetical protein